MSGKLIVFEGVDGSGKTTALHELYNIFWRREKEPPFSMMTVEPENDYAAGSFIRSVLKGEIEADSYTLALAFATNRADHCARFIAPQIALGKTILCDRYYMSSLVYQTTDGLSRNEVAQLNRGIIQPALTFWLDVSYEAARERLSKRGGVPERFDEQFFDIRAAYLREVSEAQCCQQVVRIDANNDAQTVTERIVAVYDQIFPQG